MKVKNSRRTVLILNHLITAIEHLHLAMKCSPPRVATSARPNPFVLQISSGALPVHAFRLYPRDFRFHFAYVASRNPFLGEIYFQVVFNKFSLGFKNAIASVNCDGRRHMCNRWVACQGTLMMMTVGSDTHSQARLAPSCAASSRAVINKLYQENVLGDEVGAWINPPNMGFFTSCILFGLRYHSCSLPYIAFASSFFVPGIQYFDRESTIFVMAISCA